MKRAVNQRIKNLIDYLKLSDTEFARKILLPQTTVSNIFNRDSDVKSSVIEAILNEFSFVSPDWLLTGKGEMLKSDTSTGDQLSTNVAGNINGGITGNKIQSGNINGNGNHVGIVPSDTERALVRAEWEVEHFKKEIKALKEQLKQITTSKEKEIENLKEQLKQAVIDKDRAMNMLDKALNKNG